MFVFVWEVSVICLVLFDVLFVWLIWVGYLYLEFGNFVVIWCFGNVCVINDG